MSQRLILEVVAGPLKGQTIGVPANGTMLVGRLPECGLSIPQDLTVSRQHFRIDFPSPECLLVHLSQTGETHVNNVSVSSASLQDQDQISFGTDNVLRVHLRMVLPVPNSPYRQAWSTRSLRPNGSRRSRRVAGGMSIAV